jgi:hypothetical protein
MFTLEKDCNECWLGRSLLAAKSLSTGLRSNEKALKVSLHNSQSDFRSWAVTVDTDSAAIQKVYCRLEHSLSYLHFKIIELYSIQGFQIEGMCPKYHVIMSFK